MCHYCGANLAKSSNCRKHESGHSLELSCPRSVQLCIACDQKNTTNQDISSSRAMKSNDSTASLRSIESDVSVEANFCDSSLEDSSSSKGCLHDSNLVEKDINGFDQVKHDTTEVSDINSLGPTININEDKDGTALPDDEVDAEFWLPPEQDDQGDDLLGSMTHYDDDDDECGDGVTWTKPSSLDGFEDESSESYKFKEEKLKAMDGVKNGKFRALVTRLVKSVGVDLKGDKGENWVDIATSISWEAAAFVKPDAREGKAMDPDGCVKVKCVATGLRTQSQLIKGLVFKKHAAHKHMPTKYKNPRLLLIPGSLDLSSGGLSSLKSMQQEKDNFKSIVEMIDMYHPNVILVEKSVSRDIQESILAKGITLVFDMKLHRLERVARCIGSPISASEGQKLRQCDSFRIEKFVEEHEFSTEGGKKPSKTLLFLEGAPTRLGCTILLLGANSDELKRIKCVVRCAVVMAYHLMLETSFLLDQSAMFSTISPGEVVDLALTDSQSASVEAAISGQKQSDDSYTLDIPISNNESHNLIISSEANSSPFETCSPATFPGLSISTSIEKVMNDSFPLFSDSLGSSEKKNHDCQVERDVLVPSDREVVEHCEKTEVGDELENFLNNEQANQEEYSDIRNHSDGAEDLKQSKDEIDSVFDSESILVLMSSRNASRGTICEQSHFSHIRFYRSFDVPLGKFLQDNLLNQRLQCKNCGEPPKAHFFYYAHHNKQLTIQVRQLPSRKNLPGENEGKLWMWSRCGRCKHQDGSSRSTKRVLISSAARGLSFGKFLELGFSNHSSFNGPSSCGHSFHKDFIYFFGLGPLVAMLKYSSVVTYSVALLPQRIEFNSSVRGEFLKKEFEDVYLKGISMFLEIEKSLMDLGNRYIGVNLNIQGSSKEFADIMEMLKQEKSRFEVEIQNAAKNGSKDDAVCKALQLNRVRLELLVGSCIWDHRLHSLLSSDLKMVNPGFTELHAGEQRLLKDDGKAEELSGSADIPIETCDSVQENTSESEINFNTSVNTDDLLVKEIPIDEKFEGPQEDDDVKATMGSLDEPTSEDHLDKIIPIATDIEGCISDPDSSIRDKHRLSMLNNLENDKGWIWAPFTDIWREYMEALQRGNLLKFESCSSYAAESTAQKLISDEGSRLHIPLGINDYIVSDYEDEYSSIIACALSLLKDVSEDLGVDAKLNESSQRLPRVFSLAASQRSSFSSVDSDGMQSPPSSSLEDSHSSSFDGLDLLESLVSYGASHPEVSMGSGRYRGTRKYSVISVYASEFRHLRDRCCPSEVDYIASLSRCRNWDAKGGKSKSFFAKTLDDRFIIKEIKRTEFESFMKFAKNYFAYMNQCYELENPTCLAKILGIYQVVIRAGKNGKETRHDLVVMENLSFDRQISKQYDLKGALHARFNSSGDQSGDVLLDQNFVNDMNVSPLYVGRKSKQYLQRAVYNDTNFLNSINVMDYSLLVGVDTRRHELVCGIIDYLRQYTWDKQLENWVKSSLVVPKNQLPTIVSPKEYKKRFRKFIDTHFLCVPDHWCSHRPSNPCKLCGPSLDTKSIC